MQPFNSLEAEELLANVVHDLRQPLGTIETSTFLLSILLPDASPEVQCQLQLIQRQVAMAARILQENSRAFRAAAAQRAATESLDFTKSQTAGVT